MKSKYLILGVTAIVCVVLLGRYYTYKYRAQETVTVTGLGETEFTSDLIVWSGVLTAEAENVARGYAEIEAGKAKVQKFLSERGLPAEAVVFEFVNVEKQYTPVYNANGNWAGQRFTGYMLRQRFTVESNEVEKVEAISREISSLMAQGVGIEVMAPVYDPDLQRDLKRVIEFGLRDTMQGHIVDGTGRNLPWTTEENLPFRSQEALYTCYKNEII